MVTLSCYIVNISHMPNKQIRHTRVLDVLSPPVITAPTSCLATSARVDVDTIDVSTIMSTRTLSVTTSV